MQPRILIIVSTFNRLDLTGITLDSVFRNKTKTSDVCILDDASTDYDEKWLSAWPAVKIVRRTHSVGVGRAAKERFQYFVNSEYDLLCALDNDVLTVCRFDQRMGALFVRTNDGKLTVVSGYRSNTQVAKHRRFDFTEMTNIGGLSQCVDKRTAALILERMPAWEHTWDAELSKIATRMIVPATSFFEHLGVHGTGVNGRSTDRAVGYPHP